MKTLNLVAIAYLVAGLLVLGSLNFSATSVNAEETVSEQVKEGAQDLKKNTKKTYRKVKDKTCEMVNGKLECVGKKMMHKTEDIKDEVKDKTE